MVTFSRISYIEVKENAKLVGELNLNCETGWASQGGGGKGHWEEDIV